MNRPILWETIRTWLWEQNKLGTTCPQIREHHHFHVWRMRCPFLDKPRSFHLAMEHLLISFMYSISTDDFSFSNVEFTSSVIYSTRSFCERFFLDIIWATIESLHPGRCDFCHLEHVHPKRKLRRQERPGNVPKGTGCVCCQEPWNSTSIWVPMNFVCQGDSQMMSIPVWSSL